MTANPVTPSDFAAALDALLLEEAPPYLDDNDLTIMRLVRRSRENGAPVGPDRARTILDKWTAEGKAENIGYRRERNGHKVEAWRLVK